MKQCILTIEDDSAIRRGIVDSLQFAGYFPIESGLASTGLELALTSEIDLLLLDWVLPDGDGLSILKRVRRERPTLPIIVLTARGDETDRVQGLQGGADDYVVKPFSVRELLARVEAVLRRSPQRPTATNTILIPGGVVDFLRREIRFDNEKRESLSEREKELLQYLASNRGRAISREEILSSVWRLTPQGISTRTIDMHVTRLREKLNDNGNDPQILLTVRGKGYMFRIETEARHKDE